MGSLGFLNCRLEEQQRTTRNSDKIMWSDGAGPNVCAVLTVGLWHRSAGVAASVAVVIRTVLVW